MTTNSVSHTPYLKSTTLYDCDIAIYADDTTFYSKCDQTSYLWQHLELASELESDLRDTGLG